MEDVRRGRAILLTLLGLALLGIGGVSWVGGHPSAAIASVIPGAAGLVGGLLLLARRGVILYPIARLLSVQPEVLMKLAIATLFAASAIYLGWVAVIQSGQGRTAESALTWIMAAVGAYVTVRAVAKIRQ
jgi:hypothetical protein